MRRFDEFRDHVRPLASKANDWLRQIRFQQTFTSGWSGALKVPVAEAGFETGRQLVERQMTLPELVGELRAFLIEILKEFERVVIGIDELDKLESDKEAQRFITDIKALFGISGVFYLVSVSESALVQFEQRGLPFRDVFDSSFDEVVRVEHLNFPTSRRLLDRRVIGLPMPFAAVVFLLSGGLPRDLIRAARALLDYEAGAEEDERASLGLESATVTQLAADISAKIHAAQEHLRPVETGQHRLVALSLFQGMLSRLNNTGTVSSDRLFDDIGLLTDLIEQSEKSADHQGPDGRGAEGDRVVEEALRLRSYFLLATTVLELTSEASKGVLDQLLRSYEDRVGYVGQLELLAAARRAFTVDQEIAWTLILESRTTFGLATPSRFALWTTSGS